MSNATPAEKPLEGTVIPPTVNDVPATEPKQPGKIKNALRHPVTTVKKHKLPITAAVSAVAGGVAVVLLSNRKDKTEDVVTEVDDETPNLTLLQSYNDADEN